MMLRKIGIMDLNGPFMVNVFALKPGDLIISGSDGRDDIDISKSKDERIIPIASPRAGAETGAALFVKHV